MTSLSNISNEATEENNTTGVMTPILTVEPEKGTALILSNSVERGEQRRGIPIFAKLKTGNNNDLPADTEMELQFERPSDDSPTTVSVPLKNIRPYRSLSIQDQQNRDYIDRVKHELKVSADGDLVISDVDTLYVSINSSEQIDWSNSRLNFDEAAVREV
jgi:hypothetical protein